MIFATVCYIEKDSKVLMLHRIKKQQDVSKGKWVGIGGKLQKQETPHQGVIREVFEETGLHITPILKGEMFLPLFDTKNDWHVYIFQAFECSGEIQECNEGKLQWIPKEDIFSLSLWQGDYYFLSLLSQGAYFSFTFRYHEKQLFSWELEFGKRKRFPGEEEAQKRLGKSSHQALNQEGSFIDQAGVELHQ